MAEKPHKKYTSYIFKDFRQPATTVLDGISPAGFIISKPDPPVSERPDPVAEVHLLQLPDADGNIIDHSIVALPRDCTRLRHPSSGDGHEAVYNIVMTDTSERMHAPYKSFVRGFNEHIAPFIDGETDIFTYGTNVAYRRTAKRMEMNDMNVDREADLVLALQKINQQAKSCPHRHVRVFLFSLGKHSEERNLVFDYLLSLQPIPKKQIDLFILTIRSSFSLAFCRELRLKLHTGPDCLPLIYRADPYPRPIYVEMQKIRAEINMCMKLTFSIPATIAPGVGQTMKNAYPGEYIYIEKDPATVVKSLKIYHKEAQKFAPEHENWRRVQASVNMPNRPGMSPNIAKMYAKMNKRMTGAATPMETSSVKTAKNHMKVEMSLNKLSVQFLLENLFKLWTSSIVRMDLKGVKASSESFNAMHKIFEIHSANEKDIIDQPEKSMKERLYHKRLKTRNLQCRAILNECQRIFSKSKYQEEMESAKALKTTVESKHDQRALKLKGQTREEWRTDIKAFREQYLLLKDQIDALPDSTPEDCCRVTMNSFIDDLKEPDFEDLLVGDKAAFLDSITFTGIPVLAPVKDSNIMNPWTFQVNNICISPYEILSQRAMENAYCVQRMKDNSRDKQVQLKGDDPKTVFNCIVPIIPREYTQVLKPLVTSNVFAAGCTFAILKNALVVDHNCHLAALACVWMKTIAEFPAKTRPEYIKNRILNVEETAKLYLDRPTVQKYIKCCWENPALAVVTQSEPQEDGQYFKCESLIKPAFLVQISRTNLQLVWKWQHNLHSIVQNVLAEFIGRCMKTDKSKTPFVDMYLPSVSLDDRTEWLHLRAKDVCEQFNLTPAEMAKNFYDLEGLRKYIKLNINDTVKQCGDKLKWRTMLADAQTRNQQITGYYDISEEEMETEEMEQDLDSDDSDYIPNDRQPSTPVRRRIKNPYDLPMPDMEKIEGLRNFSSAGAVSWKELRAWAEELMHQFGIDQFTRGMEQNDDNNAPDGNNDAPGQAGGAAALPPGDTVLPDEQMEAQNAMPDVRPIALVQEDVDRAFGNDMVSVYVVRALTHRSSTERFEEAFMTPAEALERIEKQIEKEWAYIIDVKLMDMVKQMLEKHYRAEIIRIHVPVARPMTRQQIIVEAQARGIAVTDDNFSRIYRYRAGVGLCDNACHEVTCPQFLQPNANLPQHLAPDRARSGYPHGLHLAASRTGSSHSRAWQVCDADVNPSRESHPPLARELHPAVQEQIDQLDRVFSTIRLQE